MLSKKEVEMTEVGGSKDAYYYKLFDDAYNFHKPRFDEYAELVAYYELQQDSLNTNSKKPWVYQINTPFATDAVNMRVASLQANDYTGELEPMSPEDVESVMLLNKTYKEMWKSMNMDNVINDAILIAAVVGDAYTHVIFDDEMIGGGTGRKQKGGLKSYFVDPASVHIDPKALSIKDADYVCVTERVTQKKIKDKYPNFDFDMAKLSSNPEERGEIYHGSDYTTEQDAKTFNKITIYERKGKKIYKTVLLDRAILVETELMKIKTFPIAQMKWQKRVKSPYGTSLMQMLLPLQKVLNEIESANANANMQYSSPSYVLSEDSGIDPEDLAMHAGAPAAVYVTASGYKISDLIQPLIPNRGIDAGLVTTKQELERSIYKLAGINDQFLGDIGTAGNTSGGADLALQRAKTIEQRILTNIEEYVEDLTHIITNYIVAAYSGDTLYSRGEKKSNGKFNFNEFAIPENASEIEYSFYIELNVKTQYSKEQQKTAIRELFEVERQYDTGEIKVLNILDILKALNIPQTEELVERYTHLTKMDASQRAQVVTEIILTGQQYGVDAEMVNSAVSEIIMNKQETPAVDQFIMMVEQIKMQQEQATNQVTNALTNQAIEAEQLRQEPTGDEEFSGNIA